LFGIHILYKILLMDEKTLLKTLHDLLALDAPSGHEEKIAEYTSQYLEKLNFSVKQDTAGNVIGFIQGVGDPILLTAHMDRVPPGRGNTPVLKNNMLKSNGSTNLGTDDAAGIVIILEAVSHIIKNNVKHPPVLAVFTVKEETGLQGARALDMSDYHVTQGICYDNAFEAATIVQNGSTYEGFDAEIIGKPTHPGKDLSMGTNALQVFLETDWMIGLSDENRSRINIGVVSSGTARNVVPGNVVIQGELRSIVSDAGVAQKLTKLENNLKRVCEKHNATYTFSTRRHSSAYSVDLLEPLVQLYKHVIEERGGEFIAKPTYVGSDANVLRAEKNIRVFTISTGVTDEHTVDERVDIHDLLLLTKDLATLLEKLGNAL